MRAAVLVCALVAGLAPCALADPANVIYQHNPYYDDPNNPGYPFYMIFPSERRVTIGSAVAEQTFEFEAALEDPNDPNGPYVGPGDIDYIIADPNAGPVTLTVVGHNGHDYGARDVGQIDLNAAGVTGTVADLMISGDLAEFGPVRAAQVDYINAPTGVILDDVELDLLTGWIWCDSMRGLTTHTPLTGSDGIWTNDSTGQPGDLIRVYGPMDMLFVGGDVLCEISVGAVASVDVRGNVLSEVQIGGTVENLRVDGDVAPPPGRHLSTGELVSGSIGALSGEMKVQGVLDALGIGGDLSGKLTVLGASNELHIDGDLSGELRVIGDAYWCIVWNELSGSLVIDGDLQYSLGVMNGVTGEVSLGGCPYAHVRIWDGGLSGTLTVNGPLEYADINVGFRPYVEPPAWDLTGQIIVHGDWLGILNVTGNITDPNDPPLAGGHVIIDGAFTGPARINVAGDMGLTTEFICVNYPGDYVGDPWTPNNFVVLGDEWINGNRPDRHVWKISDCKADLDNDGVVGIGDINPFVMALSNPSTYALAFPGLAEVDSAGQFVGGSAVFHGDLNCDGTFGQGSFGDINPFVQRLTEGCCDPSCGDCPGDSAVEPLSPQELAALLAANVDAELYDSLVTLVAENAAQQDSEEDTAYWEAVYVALTQ